MTHGRTEWQKKQIKNKCCVVCGKPAARKILTLCNIHRKTRSKRSLERYYSQKKK